ncbi:MAG TPA: hypothetical protein VMM92_11625 [Thermoanaerobaculia bacterium]|nr:hypothetical protein [Thermoanaerobaculia bacterium]
MVRRHAVVFATQGEEMGVPADCLAAMGFAPGERVTVEASPGRLQLTPFWDAEAMRADLRGLALDLESLSARLREVAGRLPEPPNDADLPSPLDLNAVGTELLGALECILADDLEPALAKLRDAVDLTLGAADR